MSKYVIFVIGICVGAAATAIILGKGRENMTEILERPIISNTTPAQETMGVT